MPFANTEVNKVKEISFHKYGLRGCAGDATGYTSLTLLASPTPGEYDWLDPMVAHVNGEIRI